MTISVTERAELAAAVSELLHDECTEQDVRRVMGSDDGFDRELWRKLAAQGVTGLLVDSEYGGVGLGALELEAVAEQEAGAPDAADENGDLHSDRHYSLSSRGPARGHSDVTR